MGILRNPLRSSGVIIGYHNLGIAPALAKEIPLPELEKSPFVILNLPEPRIESWLEDFKLCNDRFF